MPFHAGLHDGGREKVPKRADDKKRANRSHPPPKPLRQVDVIGHEAPHDEEVERKHAPDRVQRLREQLKVLLGTLLVKSCTDDERGECSAAIYNG